MLTLLLFSVIAAARSNITEFEQSSPRHREGGYQSLDRSDYEVVLISGLFNENKPTYFNEMRAPLTQDFKFPPSQIHLIHSRSNLGPDANVARIKNE